MDDKVALVKSTLRKNWYMLAAFLIPLAIRSIPEILSWPYPLGADTINVIPYIRSGWVFSLGPVGFLHTTGLFYLVASLLNGLVNNAVVVTKVLGPMLLSGLSGMMYLYSRKGLGWGSRKSLLVSILVATYFVSLRDSWDLYRQTLGLIFAVAALISLKSFSSPRKYFVACIFMVLTVLSHELAAVILFFVVGLEGLSLLRKSKRNLGYLMATIILPGSLFWFQRISLQQSTVVLPIISFNDWPLPDLALHITGLLVYCYVLILPLVLLGLPDLKDGVLRYWTALCLGIPLLTIAFPSLSLSYWNRWIFLLVYPLLFYTVQGVERLWRSWHSLKSRFIRFSPKIFAVIYLFLLLALSGYYLAATPEAQISYFSQDNPYLVDIPSSMLQNLVSINDNPAFVACVKWINDNATESSVLVEHYALYNLAKVYLDRVSMVSVGGGGPAYNDIRYESAVADAMIKAANAALSDGHDVVYTIWWTHSEGWYKIPVLPANFSEVISVGRMAVYLYNYPTKSRG